MRSLLQNKRTALVEEYAAGFLKHNERALAKTITLIESLIPADRVLGREIVRQVIASMATTNGAYRIGITGVPGVGKSTFIEAFGMHLIDQGLSVAVLAVDPTSPVSGGSLLGDRTRMTRLSAHPRAFIRPSPSGLHFGGVTRTTRQTLFACEAFGFDVIMVETVGVGQSEYAVAGMVDVFMTLMLPNAGDTLQGLKKGILEISDLLVVNKADGPTEKAAKQAARQYEQALGKSLVPGWERMVLLASALENKGVGEVWQTLQQFRSLTQTNGYFEQRRKSQRITELRERMDAWLEAGFLDPAYQAVWNQVTSDIQQGRCDMESALERLKGDFKLMP